MPERRSQVITRVSVAVLMLFQVAALLMREFVRQILGEHGVAPGYAKHLSALVDFAVLAFLLWPLLRSRCTVLGALFAQPRSWPRLVLYSVALGLAVRTLDWAGRIAAVAFGWFGGSGPSNAAGPLFWWSCPSLPYLVLSIAVMAVLTPLVEETLSRGLILHALLARGRAVAVTLSALLFAVLHTPHDMPIALVFGIIAGVQILHYGTLYATLIAHATFNFMITIDWDCLKGIWIPASTSTTIGTVATALAILMLLAAAWLATRTTAGALRAPPR